MTSPLPSLESCNKRLCIPYFDRRGVCALQFRCLWNHNHKERGCAKYLFPYKQSVTLFNLPALLSIERVIHLTEGALDAVVLTEALGMPVVGVPGADAWQSHWPAHFRGFDQIVLWADGDEAGGKMADRWQREVGAEVIRLPEGQDVNSYYLEFGGEALKSLHEGESDELVQD